MNDILSLSVFKTILTFVSTGFIFLIVALSLNIVTIHEIAQIAGLSSSTENILNHAVIELQKTLIKATDIISQLFNKLLKWAHVDADVSKLKALPAPNPDAPYQEISDVYISE